MKTFAHPVMLEDADLDYVTGGISLVNSGNTKLAVLNDTSTTGLNSDSGNITNSGNNNDVDQ
jgi:hypothetical protein